MVNLTKVFRPIAGTFTALGLLVCASSAWADTTGDSNSAPVVDPNDGFSSPDNAGGMFNDGSGPLDLIHRAVLMNDMSLSDFRQQHQNRLADEAANFRQLQQEALQRQSVEDSAEALENTNPTVDAE